MQSMVEGAATHARLDAITLRYTTNERSAMVAATRISEPRVFQVISFMVEEVELRSARVLARIAEAAAPSTG